MKIVFNRENSGAGVSYLCERVRVNWIPGLKPAGPGSDAPGMARNEIACPVCDADLPLAGDEKEGDEIFCTYCGGNFILRGDPASDDTEVEEDF